MCSGLQATGTPGMDGAPVDTTAPAPASPALPVRRQLEVAVSRLSYTLVDDSSGADFPLLDVVLEGMRATLRLRVALAPGLIRQFASFLLWVPNQSNQSNQCAPPEVRTRHALWGRGCMSTFTDLPPHHARKYLTFHRSNSQDLFLGC